MKSKPANAGYATQEPSAIRSQQDRWHRRPAGRGGQDSAKAKTTAATAPLSAAAASPPSADLASILAGTPLQATVPRDQAVTAGSSTSVGLEGLWKQLALHGQEGLLLLVVKRHIAVLLQGGEHRSAPNVCGTRGTAANALPIP